MSFEIQIKGLDELRKRIDPEIYRPRLFQTMQQMTLFVASYVKERGLSGQVLHIRTGRLKASIQGTSQMVGNIISGQVGTNVVYARIQEYGGTIKASNAPFLKFQVNGNWVQKKQVKIPARPYLGPGLDRNKEYIVSMFQKTIDLMLEGK